MRVVLPCLVGAMLLGACHASIDRVVEDSSPTAEAAGAGPPPQSGETVTRALGKGAAPGSKRGPGGFEPRGSRRNFYAGAGGRLWYYMNNYYWAPDSAPRRVWIKAEVVEQFVDLKRWPDGRTAPSSEPKVTVEYWAVGKTRRSVRLDNHKDYCLLSEEYSAGAISVQVTLTLGRLWVRDEKGKWRWPDEHYVLESRNYRDRGGIGAENARFNPLQDEAVNVWGYRVPWDVHPQRLTRSSWQRLELPEWELMERRAPPPPPPRRQKRVVTPGAVVTPGS